MAGIIQDSISVRPIYERRARSGNTRALMRALVYGGPGEKALELRPRPTVARPTDAIVRVTTTTICGTDLHIMKGDVPTVEAGRILGHEGVGIVEEVGSLGIGSTEPRRNTFVSSTLTRASTPEGAGVDVAIEAVGTPAAFGICQEIVAAGGHLANIGVHGAPVSLNLERLWSHNLTLRTGLVDTASTPMLLKAVFAGKVHPEVLVTHTFALGEVVAAYDAFAHASRALAIKVLLVADGMPGATPASGESLARSGVIPGKNHVLS